MSRCFPYLPTGCALSRPSKDALIESIKFQNEREKTKEHKEKRKEKKEKRKEKKDQKRKPEKTHFAQTQFVEKPWTGTKLEFLPKGKKTEPEQLERSGLTEEHGKSLCLRAPSTSSDSTENSNKRKRLSSPSDVTHGQANKIIRIKLPTKKPNLTNAPVIEQQPCSTSGRSIVTFRKEDVTRSRNDREQICLAPKPIETVVAPKTPKKPTNKVLTPMQRAEMQYQSLMDSLLPPQLQEGPEDLDWLLEGKNPGLCPEKKRVSGNDSMSCSVSWGLLPKAQYLQEIDMYALPYTVPF